MEDLGKLTGVLYSYIGNNVAQMLVLVAKAHLINCYGSSGRLVKGLLICVCEKEALE